MAPQSTGSPATSSPEAGVTDEASVPLHRIVVGTAGHIDHGKTRLVEALTGIDCDRWAEEKERGITIDLGFAHLEEGDLQVGFVDVPGHERFLHNALAGLGGIRVLMLVVAADEGVMPQTREHLAIGSLLAIPAGLAVLTKSDLVSPEVLELARAEVAELLAASPFAGAPVLAASSTTGAGIAELRAELLAICRDQAVRADPDRPVRLPVDRAFQLKGQGLIVTGTLAGGAVEPGATLAVLPGEETVRVRSVQVHGRPRERGETGERVALQLAGAEAGALERGRELVEPGALEATTHLLVDLELLPEAPKPLKGWTAIRLHLFAASVAGRARPLDGPLAPGQRGPAEIALGAPLVAARGDRCIVRRPSPPLTLGGGRVLDPSWRRLRPAERRAVVAALAGSDDDALAWWARDAGEAGLDAATAGRRLGLRETAAARRLDALAATGRLVRLPVARGAARWIVPEMPRRLAARAEAVLADYFRANRLARDMPRAEAVARILPGAAAELADVYLPWLEREGRLELAGDRVAQPGRGGAQLTGAERGLAERLTERFERAGLAPPSPAALPAELQSKPQVVDGVLKFLVEDGRLTRLPGGLLIATAAVRDLAADLEATGWDRFTVPRFKDRYRLTRKWAIPLLEHLDSTGRTQRIGDERRIVRKA
jgi:selenocysteine-specific elongation factor